MSSSTKIIKKLKDRIDNLFITSMNNVPSNPKTWATLIITSIARNEIENGETNNEILSEILEYAIIKSLQSGVMSKKVDMIELDESEAVDVNKNSIIRAIACSKDYIRKRKDMRSFPKTPNKWLNVLKNEICHCFNFSFPEYALPAVANRICRWYLNDCPQDSSDLKVNDIPVADPILSKDEILEKEDLEFRNYVKNDVNEQDYNKIDDQDNEKKFLVRKSTLNCIFCSQKISLVRNLVFLKNVNFKGKIKDRIGIQIHYIKSELSCDWYKEVSNRNFNVSCGNCSESLGWPLTTKNKKFFVFKSKRVNFLVGNNSFIFNPKELIKFNDLYVTEAVWKLLKNKPKLHYDQKWTCFRCTYINIEKRQNKCDFCNYTRLKKGEWSCKYCTYFNKNDKKFCLMCERFKSEEIENSQKNDINCSIEQKDEHKNEKMNNKNINNNKLNKSLPKINEKEEMEENLIQDFDLLNFDVINPLKKSKSSENKNNFNFEQIDQDSEEKNEKQFEISEIDKNLLDLIEKPLKPYKNIESEVNWKKSLKLSDKIDFRSSPGGLARGHWVPVVIVTFLKESKGISLEVMFEGYQRCFEWVPLLSGRIDRYLSHKNEYKIPENLSKDQIKFSSYYQIENKNIKVNNDENKIKINDSRNEIYQNSSDLSEFQNGIKDLKDPKKIQNFLKKSEPIINIKDKNDVEISNFAKSYLNAYGGSSFVIKQSSSNKMEGIDVKNYYSNIVFDASGISNFKFIENMPKMNRTNNSVPKEFKGTKSWGFISERSLRNAKRVFGEKSKEINSAINEDLKTVTLFRYAIFSKPTNLSSNVSQIRLFCLLLQNEMECPPNLEVYLHTKEVDRMNTNYDANVIFESLGTEVYSFNQIERIKSAHGLLYQNLCRGNLRSDLYMDPVFSMFLIAPLDGNDIDWVCVNRIYNIRLSKKKKNFLEYLNLYNENSKNTEELIAKKDLVLTTLYNTHEKHFYTFNGFHNNNKNSFSKCENENAKDGISWKDYFKTEHGIELRFPEYPLIDSFQIHPRSQSVLIPPVISKSHICPKFSLVPELCEVHPIPLNILLNMTDIVSIVWGLQNRLAMRQLQKRFPVKILLPLIEEALTFSVASSFKNYELLEFLGDSVLKYLSTDYLFFKHLNSPQLSEQTISEKRTKLIENKTLTKYGNKRRIFDYALICQFQRKDYLPTCFAKSMNMKFKFVNPFVSDKQTADLVEAILGATYLTPIENANCMGVRFHSVLEVLKWFGSEISRIEKKDGFVLKESVPNLDKNSLQMKKCVEGLEETLNYSFKTKEYVMEVLFQKDIRKSKKDLKNSEVLEILGDSVLDFLCSRKLYYILPNTSPEDLTEARIELVCNDSLALAFKKFKLDRFMYKIKSSTLTNLQSLYSNQKKTDYILPIETSVEKDNNRAMKRSLKKIKIKKEKKSERHKSFGDFVESLIGAIYLDLDRDMRKTWEVIRQLTLFSKTEECIALDCEFVGVGIEGHYNALARVSIVDFNYKTIYDKYVKPEEQIIDWRTEVSGIREKDLINAETIEKVQKEVFSIIEGKILVGHNIESDLKTLFLKHPKYLIRDTALFRKFCPAGPLSLKILCKKFLNKEIQSGEHSSVEDARETMRLYKTFMAKPMKDISDDFNDLK